MEGRENFSSMPPLFYSSNFTNVIFVFAAATITVIVCLSFFLNFTKFVPLEILLHFGLTMKCTKLPQITRLTQSVMSCKANWFQNCVWLTAWLYNRILPDLQTFKVTLSISCPGHLSLSILLSRLLKSGDLRTITSVNQQLTATTFNCFIGNFPRDKNIVNSPRVSCTYFDSKCFLLFKLKKKFNLSGNNFCKLLII